MRLRWKRFAIPVVAAFLIGTPGLMATTLIQMNLEDLTHRADKIFRGTVLEVTEGTVLLGGTEIPTFKYVVRIDEAFKGTFESDKDVPVVEIETIGKVKPVQAGEARLVPILADVPRFARGGDYVFFTTARSPVGLSVTVGLGQGLFHIAGKPGSETAVNEIGNRGLFDRMPAAETTVAGGPLRYSALAGAIRALVAAEEGVR